MRPNVHCASVVKYAQRSVNKGKSITLHAIAKAERVVERGTVGPNVVQLDYKSRACVRDLKLRVPDVMFLNPLGARHPWHTFQHKP